MKNISQSAALEQQHKELLHQLCLPETLLRKNTPEPLRRLDLNTVRRLVGAPQPWGPQDVFAESARLITEVFLGSEEGRKIHLASELDLLQRVREGGAAELLHRGAFDLMEFVFPVTVRGYQLHLIRSGKFREQPFTPNDIKEIAFATGIPLKTVEAVATSLPVLSSGAADAWSTHLRRQRDTLTAALEALMAVQNAVNADADRLTALGSMAEGMAHHFSNLLSVILGYSSLVLAKSDLSPDAAESLRKVTEAAQQARRFTEEVLLLAAQQEQEETTSSAHDRIQRVLGLLQARAGSRIEVETYLDATRDTVAAPAGLAHQMILNLLGNAFDSLPAGGRITIRTSNLDDLLRIEVVEAPVGRSAEDSDAASRTHPGMARLLGQVARLDGELNRSEALANGRRIVVSLPVATASSNVAPQKKIRRRLAPSSIWVADDDSVVREMCNRVLSAEGHTVSLLASGNDLKKRLGTAKPDLVIYDFSMPDADGLEMALWMRDHDHRVPVVLISGFTAEHPSVKKAIQMRKVFLLQKPFSFRDVTDIITIAMGETLVEG